MKSLEIVSERRQKSNQRHLITDSISSVPSPQDPFLKKNNLELRKTHTQTFRPIDLTSQQITRTPQINSRKTIRFSKTITSQHFPPADIQSSSVNLIATPSNQTEKMKTRSKSSQDTKMKILDDKLKIDSGKTIAYIC